MNISSKFTSSTTPRRLALLLAAVFTPCLLAHADITGPYTSDTNTLFLLHFNEAAGGYSTTNEGSRSGNFLTVTNTTTGNGLGIASNVTTMLGRTSYAGFGNCVGVTNTDMPYTNGLAAFDRNGDGFFSPSVQGGSYSVDATNLTYLNIGVTNPVTGLSNSPFTIEALVCPASIGTVQQEIMCTDTYFGIRGFQFRINAASQLEFNFIGAPGKQILATIPTSITAPADPHVFVPNQWYHVAVTYDGTNLTLYWSRLTNSTTACNQIGSKVAWTTTTNGLEIRPIIIGNENRGSAQECLKGLIDEVRISKICRGPSDMMFASPEVTIVKHPSSQSIDYYQPVTFSVTASTLPAYLPLAYQWRYNGAAIANETNITYTINSVDLARVGDYDVVARNTGGYSATSHVAHLTVGCDNFLAHRWSFNGDYTDSVGGATGTNNGNATVSGGALVLDGTAGTYVNLPPYLINHSNYTAVTFEFWATYNTASGIDRVFDFGNTNFVNVTVPPPENYVYFSPNYNGSHALGLAGGSSESEVRATGAGALAGQTIHVACVVDPPNHFMAIYTNGVLGATQTISITLDSVIDEKCWIGRSLFTADAYLNANIDEVRIYSGPLAAYSVAQSYQQGPEVPLNHGPVTILVQPTNTICAVGLPAAFVPVIIGNAPIDYQWYENGSAIPGATNQNLILAAPTLSQDGHIFQVMATNNVGGTNYSVASSNVTLTVRVPVNLTWAGTGPNWDTSSLNWTVNNNVSQTNYYEADIVNFDNLGNGQPAVNLTATLHPSGVYVSGTTSYTFGGPGSIAGPGALTKSGASTLIINTTNTYAGGTTVSGGTLQFGDGTYTGRPGPGPVTNNAALVFAPGASGSVSLTNTITGSGSLTVSGTAGGTVTVTASNDYSGGTTVSGGSLRPRHATALGSGSIAVTASGAQLFVDANVNLAPPALTLNGSGVSIDGALRKGGAGTTAVGATVTLGSDTTINVDGGSTLNLTDAGGLNGASANANLILMGSGAGNVTGPIALGTGGLTVNGGTWTVNPTNTYDGKTIINGGRLMVNGVAALGTAPGSFTSDQITLGNGSTAGVLGTHTSFALDDGLRGVYISTTLPAAAGFFVGSNAVLTISNAISGLGGITKSGNGTLVLNGDNSGFGGTLNLDTSSSFTNDGVVRIASPNAFVGVTILTVSNNNSGVSTLQLDGSAGTLTASPVIMYWAGRNNNTPTIQNIAGDNTFSPSSVAWNGGGGIYRIQSDTNTLTVSGTIPGLAVSGYRSLVFAGSGNILMTGSVADGDGGAGNCTNSLIKTGTGRLTLTGGNSNTGTNYVGDGVMLVDGSTGTNTMTVAGGQLGGVGTINGPTIVALGGTLAPGDQTIGTLTINNNLSLAGTVLIAVNKSVSPSNSVVSMGASTVVTNTGAATVLVTNLGTALVVGDTFKVFSQAVSNGAAMTVIGCGAAWNNNLAVDGTISVASTTLPVPVITGIALDGTSLVISGNNGYANGGFYVLSSTNLMVPRSSWTRMSTNQFGPGGLYDVTNTVVPGIAESFFTIQLQ